MIITRRMFEGQRHRRFGAANPERMSLAFWEWMVRGAEDARTRDDPDSEPDPAVLGHTPTDVRRFFGQEGDYAAGPIWNFDRMGATRTPHPDGRMICIGGEHEDHYDPDFCIYNDVIVLDLDGSVAIYGYPEGLFPPTDFHTATLLGDRVIVVGRLGYLGERHPGTTPVFSLDLSSYRIEPLPSLGERPGWIFGHEAELDPDGSLTVRGGEVFEERRGEPAIRRNFDDFAYDLGTGTWRRLTRRNWRQFSIADAGGKTFMMEPPPLGCAGEDLIRQLEDLFIFVTPDAMRPRRLAYETLWSEESWDGERILVAGIPVAITIAAFSIEVVIEGEMGEDLAIAIAEDIRDAIEAGTGRPCVLRGYA